jgi:hypothetical protein
LQLDDTSFIAAALEASKKIKDLVPEDKQHYLS